MKWCSLIDAQLSGHGVVSVAGLGCGDLAVGAAVARMGYHVTDVEIAWPVADWAESFSPGQRVTFVRADVGKDDLRQADALILRQELQHLSNAEVENTLANVLGRYPLVFVTEHIYVGPGCVPNVDMPHGSGTRVPMLSGVFIDRPPFGVPERRVGDIPVTPREALRTWVVEEQSRESRNTFAGGNSASPI